MILIRSHNHLDSKIFINSFIHQNKAMNLINDLKTLEFNFTAFLFYQDQKGSTGNLKRFCALAIFPLLNLIILK